MLVKDGLIYSREETTGDDRRQLSLCSEQSWQTLDDSSGLPMHNLEGQINDEEKTAASI